MASSTRPAIGILAQALRLGDLHAKLEVAHDAWDSCFEAATAHASAPLSELQRHRLRRQKNQVNDRAQALEVEFEEADLAFGEALADLLDRHALGRGLEAAVAQGGLSAERADYILASAVDMTTCGYHEGETPEEDEGCVWVGVPLASPRWEQAWAHQPEVWERRLERAIQKALKNPSIQVLGSLRPLHPMAWAETSVDDRYALFQSTAQGFDPMARAALDSLYVRDAQWREEGQDAAKAMTETPIRIWPVWITSKLPEDGVQLLESDLLGLNRLPQWEVAVAPWTEGDDEWISLPMPIDDVLSHTFLLQTRYVQLTEAKRMGRSEEVPTLVDLRPDQDEDGQRWIQQDLEYPNGESVRIRLPMAWAGMTPFQRTETMAKCQESWGAGASDMEEDSDEDDEDVLGIGEHLIFEMTSSFS